MKRVLSVFTLLILSTIACTLGTTPTEEPLPTPTLHGDPEISTPTSVPTLELAPVTEVPPPPTETPIPEAVDQPVREPATCPAASAISLPSEAPAFPDTAAVLNQYLSEGGRVDTLPETLREWGSISDTHGAFFTEDLDGDTVDEVIIAVQAANHTGPSPFPPGDMLIYRCKDAAYELFYFDFSDEFRIAPEAVAVIDLNNDGLTNLLYMTSVCGASTCFYAMNALGYDPITNSMVDWLNETEGTPYDTAEGEGGLPYSQLRIDDSDGDRVYDIFIDVGGQGSAGAGPQRTFKNTFIWNGSRYALETVEITSRSWPIHDIQDGDRAILNSLFGKAIDHYRLVLTDASFEDLPYEYVPDPVSEKVMLQRYAQFRIMLAFLLAGETGSAEEIYDSLIAQTAHGDVSREAGFVRIAEAFWITYSETGSIASGCEAANAYAESDPGSWDILNQYGYANKFYQPADICAIPE